MSISRSASDSVASSPSSASSLGDATVGSLKSPTNATLERSNKKELPTLNAKFMDELNKPMTEEELEQHRTMIKAGQLWIRRPHPPVQSYPEVGSEEAPSSDSPQKPSLKIKTTGLGPSSKLTLIPPSPQSADGGPKVVGHGRRTDYVIYHVDEAYDLTGPSKDKKLVKYVQNFLKKQGLVRAGAPSHDRTTGYINFTPSSTNSNGSNIPGRASPSPSSSTKPSSQPSTPNSIGHSRDKPYALYDSSSQPSTPSSVGHRRGTPYALYDGPKPSPKNGLLGQEAARPRSVSASLLPPRARSASPVSFIRPHSSSIESPTAGRIQRISSSPSSIESVPSPVSSSHLGAITEAEERSSMIASPSADPLNTIEEGRDDINSPSMQIRVLSPVESEQELTRTVSAPLSS